MRKRRATRLIDIHAVDRLQRFLRLSRDDRLLMLEAVFWLAIAGIAIAVLPFRQVGNLAARPIRRLQRPLETHLTEARLIPWAIVTIATRVPWRALCFQQGLAAQFMLRRRGIPSTLYYGAALNSRGGLHAHVWLRNGDRNVLGAEIAHQFAVLATFPAVSQGPKPGCRTASEAYIENKGT
jgi:hypothetical protein